MKELDRKTWNSLVKDARHGHVLQSWQWGELQKKQGRKIWRIAIGEDGAIKAGALVVKHPLPGGKNYLYIPRGPILKTSNQQPATNNEPGLGELLKKVGEIGREQGSVFLRIDPTWTKDDGVNLGECGFAKSPNEIQAAHTAVLDLDKSEEDLLAGMHRKTRYNIRLAKRKGVEIIKSSGTELVNDFAKLNEKTTARDGFTAHPAEHYRGMMEMLGQDDMALIWAARFKGKIISAIITTYFGRQAIYLHGVSDYEHRRLMAPHLVQWAAITDAKRRGMREYDFNGVAPADQPKHSWAGITRFKLGFSARRVDYIGGQDLVYKKFWYKLFCWAKRLRH